MKKLNFRAILILLLVVVLAFALVACGDKDDKKDDDKKPSGNKPSGTTDTTANVKEYFNTLWDLTSGIGSEAVGANEDLAISLDLGLGFDTVEIDGTVHQSIDLGLGIEAILDRSHKGSSENTAFKIAIHGAENENIATVYYFFNDPANIYIDFAGQNIVVPYNYESSDGTLSTENFSALFDNLVNNVDVYKDNSVADLIAYFSNGLGSDWTLNSLVGAVTDLFNLDIKGMLFPEDPDNSPLGMDLTGILAKIGLTQNNMFDANGHLDLKSILTNELLASMLFKNEMTDVSATAGHTEINMGILSLLGSALGDLSSIINDQLVIELDYGINNNAIDGFEIGVTVGSIGATLDGATVMPKVRIAINDLSIGKAPSTGLEMATKKDNYSSNIAVDAKVGIDLKGITLNLEALLDKEKATTSTEDAPAEETPAPEKSYGDILKERLSALGKTYNLKALNLDGTLEIGVYGKVDIASRPDKDSKDVNETALKAWLKYGNANIVEMSFVGDRIAVVVNQDAKIGDVKVVDALISLFGDKAYDALAGFFGAEGQKFANELFADETHLVVNPSFKGAVWTGINLGKNFNDLVNMAIDYIFGGAAETPEEGAAPSAEGSLPIAKIVSTITAVLPYINTENGLAIDVTGKTVGEAVAEIGKIWDKDMGIQANFIGTIVEWDKDHMLDTAIKMIGLKGVEYTDATTFLTELFKSHAKLGLSLGEDGISLGLDVDVNENCGVGLSIDFTASALTEIADLGKDVSALGNGWYYYAF